MEKVYIIGHRNPDFDSVCSAYAYAKLKNKIDPLKQYIPVRCGHLPESMKKVFAGMGIEPPKYIRDIFPKVRDIYLTSGVKIDADAPLNSVATSYKATNPSVIPVFEGNKFFGLLSVDDITRWAMEELLKNGKINEIPKVRDIMSPEEEPVTASELFEEAKRKLSSSKKRGLAVMEDNSFVGFVTRRCFLNKPRHNVILVDHNEPNQSIRGIEDAIIKEIIDHHRLAAPKTDLPIFIDAEPVGSTCTIIYQLFVRNNIVPDLTTSKVLLAGILADTIILRSPTTTGIDVLSAERLAPLSGVSDLKAFGKAMFERVEGLERRNPADVITADMKVYSENGFEIGVGQCEVPTLHDIGNYMQKYLDALQSVREAKHLDWVLLMITDVLRCRSILLSSGHKMEARLSYEQMEPHVFDMHDAVSRKMQLLPEIIYAVNG